MGTVFVWGKSCCLVFSYPRAQFCSFIQLLDHRSWTSEMSLCRLRWWELKERIPGFLWSPWGWQTLPGACLSALFNLYPQHFPGSWCGHSFMTLCGRVPLVWPFTQPCGSLVKRRRRNKLVVCLIFPLVTNGQGSSTVSVRHQNCSPEQKGA